MGTCKVSGACDKARRKTGQRACGESPAGRRSSIVYFTSPREMEDEPQETSSKLQGRTVPTADSAQEETRGRTSSSLTRSDENGCAMSV